MLWESARILGAEVVIDVLKHAVLGKFNDMRPGIYREYMKVPQPSGLGAWRGRGATVSLLPSRGGVATGAADLALEREDSAHLSGCAVPVVVAANVQDLCEKASASQSHNLNKLMGFQHLPTACLVLRSVATLLWLDAPSAVQVRGRVGRACGWWT